MPFGGSLLQGTKTSNTGMSNLKSWAAGKTDVLTKSAQNGVTLPYLGKDDTVVNSAEANALSANSAAQAMAFSAAEAQKNRDFQFDVWKQTTAYNAAEAQKNRDWQEEMSNTAYQRAMADMRAAGLNPILAYTQGGASTPGGASASTGTLSGAMGTGYSYQAMQESNAILKITEFVAGTAVDFLNSVSKRINNSGGLKNFIERLMK